MKAVRYHTKKVKSKYEVWRTVSSVHTCGSALHWYINNLALARINQNRLRVKTKALHKTPKPC